MNRTRSVALAIGLAATLAGPGLAPVLATYPGAENGRIAFGQRFADGSSNIFSVLPDGTGLRQLTAGSHNHLCAAYSPDGSKIAFLGAVGSDPSDEVYVVDATTGGGLTKLTDCPGVDTFCINDYPVWSPDGQRILFIHGEQFDADGNPLDEQVWVMDANGSHKQQLTFDNRVKDQVPDWSPDGSKIAYQSGGFGDGQIWVMNDNGSGQHQLVPGTGLQAVPAWQPRGVGAGD